MFVDHTRRVLSLSGADRLSFLQGLLTQDVTGIEVGAVRAAAFLTPQGKVVSDVMVWRREGDVLLDIYAGVCDDVMRRLGVYTLSADVEIVLTELRVVRFEGAAPDNMLMSALDPRLDELGMIALGEADGDVNSSDDACWDAKRVGAGVAQMGLDFESGAQFCHDLNFDRLSVISMTKGCYVGQEVVSRMVHKGGVKRRLMCVAALGDTPLGVGSVVSDTGVRLGEVVRVCGAQGMGILRLDRVRDAQQLFLNAIEITARLPDYMEGRDV